MASKKYRNKKCAYCGGRSSVRDHVFCREFFEVEDRKDLPCVPACVVCNTKKSALETYATALLPLATRPPHQGIDRRIDMAARRLSGRSNAAVLRRIMREAKHRWVGWNGVIQRAAIVPFEIEKMRELVNFIALGLACYHWNIAADDVENVEVTNLLDGMLPFERKSGQSEDLTRVSRNFGNGGAFYFGVNDAASKTIMFVVNFYDEAIYAEAAESQMTARSGWLVEMRASTSRREAA